MQSKISKFRFLGISENPDSIPISSDKNVYTKCTIYRVYATLFR
jgi:hypothetical protein